MQKTERLDIYQIVTDKIVALLESGTVPWRKPWSDSPSVQPLNLVSNRPYQGINMWMLNAAGYASPYWLTYKQAKELGGNVRKGEKSSIAVFWKLWDAESTTAEGKEEKKLVPILKYYNVFNVAQCEGIEYPKPETKLPAFDPIEEAETLIAAFPNPPRLTHNEQQAYYSRQDDRVNMPDKLTFESLPRYYSTLFHEFVHATGHDSRLGRLQNSVSGFGSTTYAKEELVAEMGAGYLCALSGIDNATIENSAAYIASWLNHLKNDKKLVVHAAAQAQKAVDYMTGKSTANKQK